MESPKKRLLFIKSPLHNLKAIETFLSRRNYEVIIETDIKEGLVKVIELQAEFVFIALDHTNPQIMSVPKILAQSTLAYVIPYVQTNSKEAIRKLEFSGFSHKIYPPLSGPAIERLVLKLLKESGLGADSEAKQKRGTGQKSKEEMIQIKSKILESLDKENTNSQDAEIANNGVLIQKGTRGELLKSKNKELQRLTKNILSENHKEQLKNNFNDKVRSSLEDMIETYKDFSGETEKSGVAVDLEKSLTDSIAPHLKDSSLNLKTFVSKQSQSADSSFQEIEQSTNSSINSGLSPKILTNSVRDLIGNAPEESSLGHAEAPTANRFKQNHNICNNVYCLTVQSSAWCGYLVVYSDCQIDFSTSQSLFKDWLTGNLDHLTDLEDTEQFEIEIAHADFKSWAKENADHYESVGSENNEILLSFFSIDPRSLIIDMNESELIEIPLQIIPVDKELTFSVYLHLPENKKYLLYTRTKQALSSSQQRRLTDKNIDKLYTPQEFEKEYRKLIAENHLNQLFDSIKSDKPA
ncbi:MAG: hypothetical protein H7328_11335 [Bdellovibrio sp.]|nr:hypothetical protein [Bdellovibrio sp.]